MVFKKAIDLLYEKAEDNLTQEQLSQLSMMHDNSILELENTIALATTLALAYCNDPDGTLQGREAELFHHIGNSLEAVLAMLEVGRDAEYRLANGTSNRFNLAKRHFEGTAGVQPAH